MPRTSLQPESWIWYQPSRIGDNQPMDLTEDQIEELEAALERLRELDPADLPAPAAELAALLGSILGETEQP